MWGIAALISTPTIVSIPMAVAEGTSNSSFDPLSLIGTAVTPAIVVVLLLMGKLHTDAEVKRLETELDDAQQREADKDAQYSAAMERVIPAVTQSSLVLEALAPYLQSGITLRTRPPGSGAGDG